MVRNPWVRAAGIHPAVALLLYTPLWIEFFLAPVGSEDIMWIFYASSPPAVSALLAATATAVMAWRRSDIAAARAAWLMVTSAVASAAICFVAWIVFVVLVAGCVGDCELIV